MSAATSTESARAQGLALALDDGTRKSHSMAENSAFVTGFFRGISNEKTFVQLVTSLYFVYEAMERAFDTLNDDAVKTMDYPVLRRSSALEKDMAHFYGDDWRTLARPSVATRAYVEHIERVAAGDKPWLLVAHMYTRYLGDLFGGQMMSGMATKSLKLKAGKGVEFYKFDQIPDNKLFIEDWYQKVNALPFSEEQQASLVDEGNAVFTYNIAIFEELEGSSFKAIFSLALATLRDKFRSVTGISLSGV